VQAEILYHGAGLFLLALATHVILWRLQRPEKQILTFALIFLLPILVYLLWQRFGSQTRSWLDLFSVTLLYMSLTVAYIQTYPAVQALSPSLRILLLVGNAMPKGITEGEILGAFDPKQLLEDRIQDLLDARFVQESEGRLEITPRGSLLILPGALLRRILGLPVGKG